MFGGPSRIASWAPSVAAAVEIALSGEDGVCAVLPEAGGTPTGPFTTAGVFCKRAVRPPRLRLAGVWIPRSKGSGTAGGLVVADAITAARGCAKRRIRVVAVHLLGKGV